MENSLKHLLSGWSGGDEFLQFLLISERFYFSFIVEG
jgi:hypothetical protein